MALGGKVSHSQKKEMFNNAAGFSSKFSGGGFL